MKYLDRLINFIFSLVILVLTVIIVLVSAGFLEYDVVDSFIRNNIFNAENNTITCIIAIVAFCASLKTTFFLSKVNNKKKSNIMVDTTHGKIQIAQETIENTAKNVVKDYEAIKDAQVKMVKERKGVNVYMSLLVVPNTNIIELSSKVQDEVKEAIQDTTGVKVNNVDIKIKNIAENRGKSKVKVSEEKVVKQEIVVPADNASLKEENIEAEATESIEDAQSGAENEENKNV